MILRSSAARVTTTIERLKRAALKVRWPVGSENLVLVTECSFPNVNSMYRGRSPLSTLSYRPHYASLLAEIQHAACTNLVIPVQVVCLHIQTTARKKHTHKDIASVSQGCSI